MNFIRCDTVCDETEKSTNEKDDLKVLREILEVKLRNVREIIVERKGTRWNWTAGENFSTISLNNVRCKMKD